MRSTFILIASVIAAVAVVGAALAFKPEEKVALPITVQEYADFNCPHCRDFHPVSNQIREKYKDNPNVKYEFIVHPILGPNSEQAAFASEAAKEQGKFQEYSDLLFENFEARTDEDFEKFAADLKLDVKKFNQDRENADLQKRVLENLEKNKDKGISSTPTIMINGKVQNTRNYDELVETIEDYIKKGEAQKS